MLCYPEDIEDAVRNGRIWYRICRLQTVSRTVFVDPARQDETDFFTNSDLCARP